MYQMAIPHHRLQGERTARAGTANSEVSLRRPQTVTVTAKAAAFLPAAQDDKGKQIAARPLTEQPYWHIERARISDTRQVNVELLINGAAVDTAQITARRSTA